MFCNNSEVTVRVLYPDNSVFPPFSKANISKFNSTRNLWRGTQINLELAWCYPLKKEFVFIALNNRRTLSNHMKAGFLEILVDAKLATPHIFQGHFSAGNWHLLQASFWFACSDCSWHQTHSLKDPVLFIMFHAPLNNRSLTPVQNKTITEACDGQYWAFGLWLLLVIVILASLFFLFIDLKNIFKKPSCTNRLK